ncbi:hypothetical protein GQX74_014435 [Glossina fuscipes]|nr:hypothetical protein GQX74_014435 [Glossina fuscipes]
MKANIYSHQHGWRNRNDNNNNVEMFNSETNNNKNDDLKDGNRICYQKDITTTTFYLVIKSLLISFSLVVVLYFTSGILVVATQFSWADSVITTRVLLILHFSAHNHYLKCNECENCHLIT